MRITFVLPHAGLSGGVRVIAEHAKRLVERGHEVFAVSQPLQRAGWREIARSLVHTGRWPRADERGSHLDGTAIRHRVLDRPRPVTNADVPDADVVVATWWETAEWVAGLSPAKGAKAYFLQGDETVFYPEASDPRSERVRATWRLSMRRMVVASWLRELLHEHGAAGPIAVVRNSVDLDRFQVPPRGKQSAPTLGLVYSPFSLKGADIAVEAMRRARRERSDLALVSFGADPPTTELPLPPGTRFSYRPPQAEIPKIYASCDALLFASRREGFGLPILEAMACRTPVIATPAGAAPELLADGGGLLLRTADAEEMAAAILRIAAMPENEWKQLSNSAHATARAYTWEDAVNLMEAELQQAREGSPRPAAV